MSKKTEINNTQKIVEEILKVNIKARNSDIELFKEVCRVINPDALYRSLADVLTNYKEYGLPAFETVSRTRRRLQEQFEDFRAVPDVAAQRRINEEVFRAYVQG